MITLTPVPEYPIHAQKPEDDDGSLDEDVFLPPYFSDGTLEVCRNGTLSAPSNDFLLQIVVPVEVYFAPVHVLAVQCVLGFFFVLIFGI